MPKISKPKSSKIPTMMDVAKRAGVSPMTVSRALKPNTSVNEKTRARIQEIADDLGYVLDSTAAGFSSGKTGFVAVTIPSINNANFADTVQGLTDVLAQYNLQVLLGYTNYQVEQEEYLVEQFLKRRPEVMVVSGGVHTERCRKLLENSGIPIVEIWDLPTQPIGEVVGFSNARAASLMVDHFHELGFTKIGFIGGDTSQDTRGHDRRRGFIRRLNELGLDDKRMIASGPPPISVREGADAAKTLFEEWPDTEAIMCVSDLSAFGAMSYCLQNNMRIPDDIAIAGFGAYDISEFATPALTTIDVQSRKIGINAAIKILSALQIKLSKDLSIEKTITPKILKRKSTIG